MSIGNILLGLIALCMVVLVVGVTIAFFYFRKKLQPKEIPMVIEVEGINPNLTQGYGFVVDDRIILKDDKTPMLIRTKESAEKILVDLFNSRGEIVYQKWDLEKRQVTLGKVKQHGTN